MRIASSPSGVPCWFAWLLLAMVLVGVVGIAGVLFAEEVTLSWTANTESDLAGYKLYQSTIAGQYGPPVATLRAVTRHILTLPDLAVDQTYFFTLTAYDQAGNESVRSNEVSKMVAGIPATIAPGVPDLTVIAISPTELDIRWPTISDGAGGIASVDIRLGSPTDHWGLMVPQVCPASPCRVTGLTGGTAYQVQAVAYRAEASGNVFGTLSTPISVTTPMPDLPPAPPQGLTIASATPDKIIIVAHADDCKKILTTITGTTQSQHRRTLTCVRP